MKNFFILFLAFFFCFLGCKKPAGSGGNSSIKGTVMVEDYNSSLTSLKYTYPGVDVEVYIIYGDDITAGDKVNTNSKGEFEFKYLRKGKYQVYAVTKEKVGTVGDTKDGTVSVDVTISKNKETVNAGQLTIKS